MEPPDRPSPEAPSSEQLQANHFHLVMDIAWFGLALPAATRFLSVYAIRLDATPMLLGWMAALPAILALLTSPLSAWWRTKFSDTVHAQRWPGVASRLVFLLPALTPFFPAEWQPAWLVAAAGIPALAGGVSSVLFLVLIRQAVEAHQLTSLLSRRSLVVNITVAVATLAFGFWLEVASFPFNYQSMFVLAFVLSLISLWHVGHVHLPPEPPVAVAARPAARPWRAPAFQRVALITVIMHFAFFSVLPIIPLRLMDELGADEAFMSIFALFELGAAAVMSALASRIIRRFGSRATMAWGLAGTGVAAIILALAPDRTTTLIASAVSGGTWTMAAISLFGFFSENTPPDSVTSYTTVYNQIVMLSVFIGPIAGSQLASTSLSLTTVLLIGGALRLAAGALIPFDLLGRGRSFAQPVSAAPK
jgi:MFS family permease